MHADVAPLERNGAAFKNVLQKQGAKVAKRPLSNIPATFLVPDLLTWFKTFMVNILQSCISHNTKQGTSKPVGRQSVWLFPLANQKIEDDTPVEQHITVD